MRALWGVSSRATRTSTRSRWRPSTCAYSALQGGLVADRHWLFGLTELGGVRLLLAFLRLDLAQRSHGSIAATAAVLVVSNRQTGEVVNADVLAAGEAFWGRAILECIARHKL